MLRRDFLTATLLLAAGTGRGQPASTDWPNRPIRLVVPVTPGGLTDIPARLLAAHMSRTLGQQVVVENRPGASGTIASDLVRKLPPDGYALLYCTAASHAQSPAFRRNVPYNPVTDFMPVARAVVSPFAILCRAGRPERTMEELLATARREGRLTFGTTGPASTGHIFALQIAGAKGVAVEPIHFGGDSPAIQEVLAGRLDLHYAAAARQYVEAGLLRALATTGANRWDVFPDAPTLLELGVPDSDLSGWNGILAPVGTPAEVVAKLNAAVGLALADAEVTQRLAAVGLTPHPTTAAGFGAFMADEFARYQAIAANFNLHLD